MNIIQTIILLGLFVYVGRWIFAIVLSRRGVKLMDVGQLDRADAFYTWLQKYYKTPIWDLNKAIIAIRREHYETALAYCETIITSRKPNKFLRPLVYAFRAYLYLYLRRYDDAFNDYHTVTELYVDNSIPTKQYDAYWGLVACYFYQQDYSMALVQAEKSLGIVEPEVSIREKHGAYLVTSNKKMDTRLHIIYIFIKQLQSMAYAYSGNHEQAKQIFVSLAEKFSNFMPFYVARAELSFLLGDYAEALADYEKVISSLDDTTKRLYSTISGYNLSHVVLGGHAVVLFACGEIEQAQAQWRDLQTKAPLLTSAERVGKEFFWSEEMLAKAKELEASFM